MANKKSRIFEVELFDGFYKTKTFFVKDNKGRMCECFIKNIGESAVGKNTWMVYEIHAFSNEITPVVSRSSKAVAMLDVRQYLGSRGSCYKSDYSAVGY